MRTTFLATLLKDVCVNAEQECCSCDPLSASHFPARSLPQLPPPPRSLLMPCWQTVVLSVSFLCRQALVRITAVMPRSITVLPWHCWAVCCRGASIWLMRSCWILLLIQSFFCKLCFFFFLFLFSLVWYMERLENDEKADVGNGTWSWLTFSRAYSNFRCLLAYS